MTIYLPQNLKGGCHLTPENPQTKPKPIKQKPQNQINQTKNPPSLKPFWYPHVI